MPIHEFACEKCGHEFEELVFDDSPVQCPACGANDTRKLMSACCRRPRGGAPSVGDFSSPTMASGGCGSCSGGNCASCGH